MNLEVIDDGSAIEKGASKRKMSEKQLANLAAGRAKKAANAAERQALAIADKAEKASKVSTADRTPEIPEPVVRRKRTKQVIVFDDDSESEHEAPQIVIKQKRTQRALPPQPPPSPPPSPPPIPKLRRV